MFVWYWTAAYTERGMTSIDVDSYPWTDMVDDNMCIVRPSDCCLMVPPDGWDCE